MDLASTMDVLLSLTYTQQNSFRVQLLFHWIYDYFHQHNTAYLYTLCH